jgi:hypothetical protein
VPEIGSLHDSVSCLFVPTDCWFFAFEKVGYRTTCEHKILCFAAQLLQRHVECLKKCMLRWQ